MVSRFLSIFSSRCLWRLNEKKKCSKRTCINMAQCVLHLKHKISRLLSLFCVFFFLSFFRVFVVRALGLTKLTIVTNADNSSYLFFLFIVTWSQKVWHFMFHVHFYKIRFLVSKADVTVVKNNWFNYQDELRQRKIKGNFFFFAFDFFDCSFVFIFVPFFF